MTSRGVLRPSRLLSVQEHVTATRQSDITAGLRANPNFNLVGSD
jgi:hypothetical protein